VNRLGEKTRETLNKIFDENAFSARATGIGSLLSIHTTVKKPVRDAKSYAESDHEKSREIFEYLLETGILMIVPEMLHGAISYAHTDTHIDHLTSTIEQFVKHNPSASSVGHTKMSST
jgi:glutamate-1-semialdehyde aminotransferase